MKKTILIFFCLFLPSVCFSEIGVGTGPALKTIGAGSNISEVSYDLFFIGGQSQMPGRGEDPSASPNSSHGIWVCTNGTSTSVTHYIDDDLPCQCNDMADQLGNYSSAWPTFADTYYETTGRNIILICVARGGSAVYPGLSPSRGDWSESGALFGTATAWIDATLQFLSVNGYHYDVKGGCWGQGEAEGSAINDSIITSAQYKTATESVFSRFRTKYGTNLNIYIFETGDRTTESYSAIRIVQNAIASEQAHTYMVFTDAQNYISYGWMATDGVHYKTVGYNNMGELAALSIAGILY